MKLGWEIIVQDIAPSLRAVIARELTENYGLTQTEAAKLMGISQPAISQYLRRIRGKNEKIFSDGEITNEVKRIAALIYDKKNRDEINNEFTNLCRQVAEKSFNVNLP